VIVAVGCRNKFVQQHQLHCCATGVCITTHRMFASMRV